MKIYAFFKLLNYKIKQYEKAALRYKYNGDIFSRDYPITQIWVEDNEEE